MSNAALALSDESRYLAAYIKQALEERQGLDRILRGVKTESVAKETARGLTGLEQTAQ